jgi:DNA-binding MarR family transcriptional regulator
MTRIVQGLEQDGLARRAPDANDGRVVRVRATARGRRLLKRARERRISTLAERLSQLEPDQIALVREAAELVDAAVARPALTRT